MANLIAITLFLSAISFGDCARILFYIGGVSSHSHRASSQPLANALAARGHQITYFGPQSNPESNKNISDFCPTELKEFNKFLLTQFGVVGFQLRQTQKYANGILSDTALSDLGYMGCEAAFKSPEFKPWLESQEKFDLVIIDSVVNDCAYGLAHYWKAKTMMWTPISAVMPWDTEVFGLPSESSWVPNMDNNYEEREMDLKHRWINAWTTIYWGWKYQSYHLPRMDALIKSTLPIDGAPYILDMVKKTSLILLNQHYSDHFPRAYPPFVVPVGGMHLKKGGKPLPADIEKFVSSSSDGFVYVSFGSALNIAAVPRPVLDCFFDAMRAHSNVKFLWKWDGDFPTDAPANVMFKHWFPQVDILAHKKIRGYVMQGGQISFQQAIHNGVPLIIFPVNGDQDLPAKFVRRNGNGIEMEFAELTAQGMKNSFSKLLSDKSYAERAKDLEAISNDRIMSSLDTALWWTEYVLRAKNTDHLKPGSINQSWWLYRNLDVFGLTMLVALLIVFAAAKVLRCVVGLFSGKANKVKKS